MTSSLTRRTFSRRYARLILVWGVDVTQSFEKLFCLVVGFAFPCAINVWLIIYFTTATSRLLQTLFYSDASYIYSVIKAKNEKIFAIFLLCCRLTNSTNKKQGKELEILIILMDHMRITEHKKCFDSFSFEFSFFSANSSSPWRLLTIFKHEMKFFFVFYARELVKHKRFRLANNVLWHDIASIKTYVNEWCLYTHNFQFGL